MITADQLVACGVGPTQAGLFAAPLSAACERFDIDTPARRAALIGQVMVESGSFVHTAENLFYSDPARIALVFPREFRAAADAVPYARNPAALGARAYAGRMGNGDEASGDGYTYRGRGLLQITGRDSYANAATGLGAGYLDSPDLVAQPADACLTAGWFWHCNKLNALADANAIDAITRAVNGSAMRDANLRRQYTQAAIAALT